MDSVDMSYLYNTNNNSISLVVSAVASAAVAAATNNNNNNESIDDTSTNLSRRLPYVWVDSSASLSSSSSSTLDDCARIDASNHRRIENLLRASNMLLMVYPWVLMCTGTITNAISFAVLTRPKLKKSSTFFYLACLCVIDLLSLYTFCINFIFFYHFKVRFLAFFNSRGFLGKCHLGISIYFTRLIIFCIKWLIYRHYIIDTSIL